MSTMMISNQCANAINFTDNVNSATRKVKGRCQDNVGLFLQTMKLDIFCNGCKSIPNDIMGYNPVRTMGAAEEMDPHGV
jgi:hypothetical protein